MKRGLAGVVVAMALIAPAVTGARPPFRQQCIASWISVSAEDWGSAWWIHFEGQMSCGFDAPTNLPSQMNLRVPKDSCNAGSATGGIEVRASGQDFWQHADLVWAPGGGLFTLQDPASHGVAWVMPQYDINNVSTCPAAYSITAAFVYNTLDGTKIPPNLRG